VDPHSPLSTQLGNNTNVVVWLRVTDRNSASPSSLLVLDYLHAHFQVSNWDERPDAEPLRFAGYHNRLLNPLYTQPRNEGHRLSFDSGSCLHGWVNIPLLDYDDHWRLEYRDDSCMEWVINCFNRPEILSCEILAAFFGIVCLQKPPKVVFISIRNHNP